MRCPECEAEMSLIRRDEDFEYDTGRGMVRCHAHSVPVDICSGCGLITSGIAAAAKRSDAILREVLDLLRRLVPAPKGDEQ